MSPEKQRMTIAEACRWIIEKDEVSMNGWWIVTNGTVEKQLQPFKTKEAAFTLGIPDYLNDLNAMHEVENFVFPDKGSDEARRYRIEIFRICDGWDSRLPHATAAQRAEAFLKTIGKWEEAA